MSDPTYRYPLARPLGHETVIERLARLAARTGSTGAPSRTGVPHALVFSGPDGVGKFHAAIWWASRLKCERSGKDAGAEVDTAPCGCPACAQIAAGTHPDVLVLAPEANGKAISIDAVRDAVIATLSLKPVRPGPRIAIVRDAELLGVPAQNAMLKVLEEPPGDAVIILVTGSQSALLPTIRSRCQALRFGPLSEEILAQLLEERGTDPEVARAAGVIARGSAGRALACDAEELADRIELIVAFERFRAGRGPSMEELVTDLADRRKNDRAELPVLLEWQMRKVETAYGCRAGVESDRLAPLLARAAQEPPERLVEEAVRTRTAIRHLERNANRKLALRDMLLDIRAS